MPKGTELIVGMTRTQFGPLIAFGLVGFTSTCLKMSFRLASGLTGTRQIEEMLAETKAFTPVAGYRGEPPRICSSGGRYPVYRQAGHRFPGNKRDGYQPASSLREGSIGPGY